jgi:hypothetical protein
LFCSNFLLLSEKNAFESLLSVWRQFKLFVILQ